jgi:hypothetical protein
LTRRGGGSVAAAGLGGSAFLAAPALFAAAVLFPESAFLGLWADDSANRSPLGSFTPRCRAIRSTNCRATTSSIVLDALFTSIP